MQLLLERGYPCNKVQASYWYICLGQYEQCTIGYEPAGLTVHPPPPE